ncbi:MAG: hypothetical protein MN733_19635, partial [Nitrososphaera sp.]|nr:hypothetical protein [Nitrososphaera sp.]
MSELWLEVTTWSKRCEQAEMARTAAERRAELFERQVAELKSENRSLRDKRSGTEEMLQKEIWRHQLQISDLTEKLEKAEKLLVWFRNGKFNRTSEKGTGPKPEEPASQAKDDAKKANSETSDSNKANPSEPKKNRGQQPGSKGHGRSDRSELNSIIKYLDIPGGCVCGKCGRVYRLMARTEASPITEFEAKIVRTVFQRCIYVAQCDCEGRRIRVADPPPKLYPRTEIGNSLWVWL